MENSRSKLITMSKLIKKFVYKQSQCESGFTLMEVIVASLMVFLFVVGSMQAMALSVAIRIKAQERQRADQLIQEDIEQIRLVAEDMDANHSLCSATAYSGGYAEALASDSDFPANNATKRVIEDVNTSPQYQIDRTVVTGSGGSTSTILKLNYEVKEVGKSKVITTDYFEVIPNAAIQCP